MTEVTKLAPETDDAQELEQNDLFSVTRRLVDYIVALPGLGRRKVYVYEPISLAERAAFRRHVKSDGESVTVGLEGIVDCLILRLRDKQGKQIYFLTHRRRLLEEVDADMLRAIWNTIGGVGTGEELTDEVDDAKKN